MRCANGHPLDPSWTSCPYCAASRSTDSRVARRGIRVPLRGDFRFIHEPVEVDRSSRRFIGREAELDRLAQRILYSDGGSFLITGYRGVGKTSFVHQVIRKLSSDTGPENGQARQTRVLYVCMNITKPISSSELMHQIVRGLYDKIREQDLHSSLDPALWSELKDAYWRTSLSITRKAAESGETAFTLGDISPATWIKLGLSGKRTVSKDMQATYLGYEEKAAEYDIIRLTRHLRDGYEVPAGWASKLLPWRWNRPRKRVPLKLIFVFDELDKLDESVSGESAKPFIDDLLSNLKSLFTTSGISFVFIAGRDLHERWLDDVSKGDSIYESVFSYDKYLCCLWENSGEFCDAVIDSSVTRDQGLTLVKFRKYVAFRGRGIPRRMLRTINEHVTWADGRPIIFLEPHEWRRVQCYAELYDALQSNEALLFGAERGENRRTHNDRRRLGALYMVDWMLTGRV